MSLPDKDLHSIQEARQMVERAYAAQKVWATATQQQVDRVCEAMAQAAFLGAERLGTWLPKRRGSVFQSTRN